jgi:DNA-binding transcriptional regulator PaaX
MSKSLEKVVKKQVRRSAIQKNVTLLLARLTGRQGRLLFVSKEVLIKQLGFTGSDRSVDYRVYQALQRLERKGLVIRSKNTSSWSARLTPKGEKFAHRIDINERLSVSKPARWDGRWRIIIFDIWERRKPVREKLRRALQSAGFYKVQDSVWAYPNDCEDLLVFLRADLRLGSGVLYLIAEGIEGDSRMRRHFGLN